MLDKKVREHGVSHGLAEAGYDIRIKQTVEFRRTANNGVADMSVFIGEPDATMAEKRFGRFTIASAIEEFDMPGNLVGIVHDKSTWARRGLSVFNTVIEPGWKGFLTLELVYHGQEPLLIPAGAGIAQVLFHRAEVFAAYDGKYQHQVDEPVPAIHEPS